MAYGQRSSQKDDSPDWGFLVFILVICAIAVVVVSGLALKANGTL
jgi:Na+-transporting NADH:ubiquinone oxidoreductase subunit NqrC